MYACRKVDSILCEAGEVRQLFKSLTQNFSAVVLLKFAAVSEVSDACKRFEELQRQRILQGYQPSHPSSALPADRASLGALIHSVIQEELDLMKAEKV